MLDLLITGGLLHAPGSAAPKPQAIGIKGNQISFVGDYQDAPSSRQQVELNGELVTPGFIDSHNHLLLGFDPDAVNLVVLAELVVPTPFIGAVRDDEGIDVISDVDEESLVVMTTLEDADCA